MREYLFRGKRVDNGEWETGSLVVIRGGCSDVQVFIADKMTGYHTPVIPDTVGQYTGLTDKNGVKVFEGDIVRNGYSSPLGEFWDNGNVVYVQTDGCFEICNIGEWHFKRLTQTQIVKRSIEVIGNIHDNPELLGGDDNA